MLIQRVGEGGVEGNRLGFAHFVLLLEVEVGLEVSRSPFGVRRAHGDRPGPGILGHINPFAAVHNVGRERGPGKA